MTKTLVEKIRLAYATGKYDKLSLFLSYKDAIKAEDVETILEYKVFPEVRGDLALRILEIPIAQEMYSNYQEELRMLVKKDTLSDSKYFPYPEAVALVKEKLIENLSILKTITFENLRGFYLEDAGLES
jgi:hypothetical protein